jgi:hypothetical protein
MLQALIAPVSELLGKVIPDVNERAKLAHEIATMSERMAHEQNLLQAQANVESAKSSSMFVAGARPAIMWICALGLFMNFFVVPLLEWGTPIFMPDMPLPKFEQLQSGELMTLTMSLLGLGGMRSWEKKQGVARNNMK